MAVNYTVLYLEFDIFEIPVNNEEI